jgi:hypothetical protein
MLCEECNKREATFFFSQSINGEVLELRLCVPCAGPLADTPPPGPPVRSGPPAREIRHRPPPPPPPRVPIPPDPERPAELELPEKISVLELAAALKLKPYQVIGMLMEINLFHSMRTEIDFPIAAHICSRCRVVARRAS